MESPARAETPPPGPASSEGQRAGLLTTAHPFPLPLQTLGEGRHLAPQVQLAWCRAPERQGQKLRSANNCCPCVCACWTEDRGCRVGPDVEAIPVSPAGGGVRSGFGKLQGGKTLEVDWRGGIRWACVGLQRGPCWVNDPPWHRVGLGTCDSCPAPHCLPLPHLAPAPSWILPLTGNPQTLLLDEHAMRGSRTTPRKSA